MRFLALLFFILFLPFLQGEELFLKKELAQAKEKSWVVAEFNKNFLFFYIREVRPDTVIIEEVFVPLTALPKNQRFSWKNWFENGGKGHTIWTLSEISKENGRFIKTYSYTHHSWLKPESGSSFMDTLLNIRFFPVPYDKRKRIGSLPPPHLEDKRPFWQPKMVVEGQRVSGVPFTIWHTRWPADQSELSKKRIEIYLPQVSDQYPSYFPYWLEVEGKIGSAHVRVVDSGIHAISPQPDIMNNFTFLPIES